MRRGICQFLGFLGVLYFHGFLRPTLAYCAMFEFRLAVYATQQNTIGPRKKNKWEWKEPNTRCPVSATKRFRRHVKKVVRSDSRVSAPEEHHTPVFSFQKYVNVFRYDGNFRETAAFRGLVFLIWFCPGNSGSWTSSFFLNQSACVRNCWIWNYRHVTSQFLQDI